MRATELRRVPPLELPGKPPAGADGSWRKMVELGRNSKQSYMLLPAVDSQVGGQALKIARPLIFPNAAHRAVSTTLARLSCVWSAGQLSGSQASIMVPIT
jgi:hypothetical protein